VRGTLTALYREPHQVTPDEARAIDHVASQAVSILRAFPAPD
jgi:hypothetical protein